MNDMTDPQAMVEAVLNVLAPKADLPAGFIFTEGLVDLRVPRILFDHEGTAVRPNDDQLRALAEQIVTAIRTATADAKPASPAQEFLANPDWARGYVQAQRDIPANLLQRIKQIEQPDGSWPGGDVVDILTSWFTDLGFDIEADLDEEPEPDEPEPEPFDPGPECDDQGGATEYRYILPEDYLRDGGTAPVETGEPWRGPAQADWDESR